MKVLITAGTSLTSLKLLKAFTGYSCILADYGDVPSLNSAAYKLMSLGIKNLDVIAHQLLSFCLDEKIDCLLPLYDFEIDAIAKSKVLFNEFGIEILLPETDQIPTYLSVTNAKDFMVVKNGEVIFSTLKNNLIDVKKIKNLNGAFYIDQDPDFNLKLISITN